MDTLENPDYVLIGKKRYRTILVRGHPHVRIAANLPVEIAEKFITKCQYVDRDLSQVVNLLVRAFNISTGWIDQRHKNMGDLFDPRPEEQIEASVWQVNETLKKF